MGKSSAPTSWIYWELGLLSSLVAMAATPVDANAYGAYGLVTMLFAWGMVREVRHHWTHP